MTTDHRAEILDALSKTPGFADIPEEALTITRMGGLTNLVFRVDAPEAAPVVVRLAGAGTEEYIDRVAELTNAEAAARAGVSAAIHYAEPETGLLVMDCIENVTTMTPENFAAIKGSPGRAGAALRLLHQSGEKFAGRFELFQMIEDYLDVLSKKANSTLPDGYHDVVAAAAPVREALEAHPVDLAPCHCDPLCENFLDDGQKMWIVDYEYGGMNDPLWDLGDVSVEGHFTEAMEAEMLQAYFGRSPTAAEKGRVVIYKAMCDLIWTLWGLIQHADGNPAEDFWLYAVTRFDRCQALMNAPEFDIHVANVKAG
ncbi:phosphotransferase family protein [Nioella nitratireducens]|uniref:phosphotransferase family protein n=1 Tax=Nioella nitratireducens TaxID=1287720 RepID=UPI0008FCF3DF|nr:phosphotransferase family protein [Nioella nitratireducens]